MLTNEMSVEEASKLLGVGKLKIRYAVKTGQIKGIYMAGDERDSYTIYRKQFYKEQLCWNDNDIEDYEKTKEKGLA